MKTRTLAGAVCLALSLVACGERSDNSQLNLSITKEKLLDKVKGSWAGKTIGCTYGGPTEFRYVGTMMQDYIPIPWSEGEVKKWYDNAPGLYDDVYVALTFADVVDKHGFDAPADSFAMAFLRAGYPLDHANQAARYNLLQGIMPPECGHWKNNPHADCIDFQIESDFAGIMTPGMPNSSSALCDKAGHIMSYGNGWYGGVFVAAMYSVAYVSDDINFVVSEALKTIPKESTFHQCMADVIRWHAQYPTDWKQTWLEVERKWSEEISCPDGVQLPFDIEALMNSAYVVMGLLYGEGDFYKTMDVSTRCGQDSDCNPSTAAGILGTMLGYSNIPTKWTDALKPVADRPFSHTQISLNTAYELSMRNAIKEIVRCGGKDNGESVDIAYQKPEPVRLEVSFEGLELVGKEPIGKYIAAFDSIKFEGTGIAIKGYLTGGTPNRDYVAEVEILVDGKRDIVARMPDFFDHRRRDLYYEYELPKGSHVITCKWLNPKEGVDIWMNEAVLYTTK